MFFEIEVHQDIYHFGSTPDETYLYEVLVYLRNVHR